MPDDDNAAQAVAHRAAVDKAVSDEGVTDKAVTDGTASDETASDETLSQKEQLNDIGMISYPDGRVELVRLTSMALVNAGISRTRHTFAYLILEGKQKPLMAVFSGYNMQDKPESRVLPNGFWTRAVMKFCKAKGFKLPKGFDGNLLTKEARLQNEGRYWACHCEKMLGIWFVTYVLKRRFGRVRFSDLRRLRKGSWRPRRAFVHLGHRVICPTCSSFVEFLCKISGLDIVCVPTPVYEPYKRTEVAAAVATRRDFLQGGECSDSEEDSEGEAVGGSDEESHDESEEDDTEEVGEDEAEEVDKDGAGESDETVKPGAPRKARPEPEPPVRGIGAAPSHWINNKPPRPKKKVVIYQELEPLEHGYNTSSMRFHSAPSPRPAVRANTPVIIDDDATEIVSSDTENDDEDDVLPSPASLRKLGKDFKERVGVINTRVDGHRRRITDSLRVSKPGADQPHRAPVSRPVVTATTNAGVLSGPTHSGSGDRIQSAGRGVRAVSQADISKSAATAKRRRRAPTYKPPYTSMWAPRLAAARQNNRQTQPATSAETGTVPFPDLSVFKRTP